MPLWLSAKPIHQETPMPQQKSTHTTSRPPNTAPNSKIHAISRIYRRLRFSLVIISAIGVLITVTIQVFSASKGDLSVTIPVGFAIGTFALLFLSEFNLRNRSPQQPNLPTNPPTPYTIHHTLTSTAPITTASWSPDGQTLACADKDRTIHLWHAQTGTLQYTLSNQQSLTPIPVGWLQPLTSRPNYQFLTWSIVWSPDSQYLATSNLNGDIRLWHTQTGQLLHTLSSHQDLAWSVAWSPDSHKLASGSLDRTACLWDTQTGQLLHKLSQHTEPVITVAWSPDGQTLASGSLDKTICLWNVEKGSLLHQLSGHISSIRSLFWSLNGRTLISVSNDDLIGQWKIEEIAEAETSWQSSGRRLGGLACSPDGRTLAIGFSDHSVSLVDITTGLSSCFLEGHTNPPSHLAFSSDSQSLASFAFSDPQRSRGTLLIWRKNANNWAKAIEMPDLPVAQFIAFHPDLKAFATLDQSAKNVVIWKSNDTAIDDTQSDDAVYYRNAKVVLVGDSGVGKSGLGMVLMDKPFEPTESTHARHIWTLHEQKIQLANDYPEIREILLWDLAGQPGYRLIHQLHLDEVTLALIVFDARSETDPFAGVFHWERALQQAQCIQGKFTFPLKKFLVAARVDRGGVAVSDKRIADLQQKFNFERYFQTSAKTGREIAELKKAITDAIVWDELPGISSTQLFQKIKSFLIAEKEAGRPLETVDALYRLFLIAKARTQKDDLRAPFETCIARVESAGLIKRLSFGNLVLLQPELLDIYASALINAVRDEPEGFGSIEEERVKRGDFFIPEEERLQDKTQERMLLIAMVEDLLYRELILREGEILVFPAQSTRDDPDLPEPEKKAVTFTFDGPILNIYATLAVRLANSGMFQRDGLWKNAVTYSASIGGTCGLRLETNHDGHGTLSLFFDTAANEQTRYHFEEYVQLHLQRKALPDSLIRRRIFTCMQCSMVVTEQMVQLCKEHNLIELDCPICKTKISLLDREQRIPTLPASLTQIMDHAADRQREREARKSKQDGTKSILAAKRERNQFDVFLCCNDEDKPVVRQYGEQLKDLGILPWFAEWDVQPGISWQSQLEAQIPQVKSAAIFIGKTSIEKWERLIKEALIREFVRRDCPVVPVLLPEATQTPKLPLFLEGLQWVDFRQAEPDPLEHLIWGITGQKPHQPE
jgi:WD40 repeat protein/GTPase SAR1 family protein